MANRVDLQHRGTGAFIDVVTASGRNSFAYGTRAGGASKPFTDRTVVPIESLTKVFTALLLADMVRQGQTHRIARLNYEQRCLKPIDTFRSDHQLT